MIGPLNQVSSYWLATGRAVFKLPIADGLPGAFADLLFDPAERYAQLWALALDETRVKNDRRGFTLFQDNLRSFPLHLAFHDLTSCLFNAIL